MMPQTTPDMLSPALTMSPVAARAALEWLMDAGVDTAISDTPRNWLAGIATPVAAPPPREMPVSMPASLSALVSAQTLEALHAEVAAFAHPLRPSAGARPCLFEGPEDAPLLVLDEMAADAGSDTAVLVKAMLAAIGLDIAEVARVHALPWPTTGGRAARSEELADFAPFARAAITLARPRRVLALGQHLAEVMVADSGALGSWTSLGEVPVLATLSPARLLRAPRLKAEAWAHLQNLASRMA
ncbi:uracil-DNA glycosylase family protein [Polymorphobacter sp.]|uniref:uracil-DNA glycosylase family protein n=1 Tax=Polymorphobacter sp. TaxID=1909290 RepID=UPI003F6F784B